MKNKKKLKVFCDLPPMAPEFPPLTPLYRSEYCQYSVLENKMFTLYQNQEKIYALLQKIAREVSPKVTWGE